MSTISIGNKTTWENPEVRIDVLYSAAGVSSSVILTSKFTGKIMLLDAGDGVLRDLLSMGSLEFVNDLDVIGVTHGHFDHVGGLYALLGFLRMMKRTDPLNIVIPAGCLEVPALVNAFRRVYGDTTPYRIFIHEMGDGTGFDTDFFKTQAIEVEHWGLENVTGEDRPMPALGYRVVVGSTTIGYTGDTRLCPGAEAVVKDADIALIESTRKTAPESGPRVHLTVEEARRLAELAREAILVHQIPEVEGWEELEKKEP